MQVEVSDPGLVPPVIYVGGRAYPMPKSVQRFVDDFDSGKPVEPIWFDLDITE
jgi:hypothetical protein